MIVGFYKALEFDQSDNRVSTVSCMVRKLSERVVQPSVKLLEGSHIAILVINSYMPVYVYIDCYMCTQPLV